MSSFSNDKDIKVFHKPATDDEDFLKEFSRDFYQKFIDIKDLNVFECTLSKWIKDTNRIPQQF